ncbi:MAG: LytTR family transcriptional regulator [Bacteroidales bacterium]|nr:LytTR family transcriptional regulator [Bacteroidales bacterium]
MALTLFFAILLVVFGQPVSILNHTSGHSAMVPMLQVALTVSAGLLVVIVSRFLLLLVSKRLTFSPAGYILWVMVELIVTIAASAFTLWRVSGGGEMMLTSLAADLLLGVITVESLPYIISYLLFLLRQEHTEVLRLQDKLDQLQPTQHVSSPTSGDRIINFHNKGNRLVFSVECKAILFIEAADNYTNIHYLNEEHEDTYILHNTLKELEQTLAGTPLIRCHRGYMVNIENVRRLQRKGHSLQLELNGSSKIIPVTKTYADLVAERITNENQQ